MIFMSMCSCLQVPDCGCCIKPGNIVKLGRFDRERWKVANGWYTWGGNRPVCGWYLINVKSKLIKPLQLTDLDDIYVIESVGGESDELH